MDADGIDNPSGQCDAGVSGFGFGDGIIDNERYGLTKFVYFMNGGPAYGNDPSIAIDYYNYLNGKWKDGTQMMWGGNAHTGGPGVCGCGPDCTFMFPGNSDPLYWGDSCTSPNCTPDWTEQKVGNQPGDRRGLGASGPFTFMPGSVEQLDLAFVFARNFVDSSNTGAISIMQQRIDSVRKYFKNGHTPCGGDFSGITSCQQFLPQLKIYPNPTANNITIEVLQHATINILTIQGQLIKTLITTGNKTNIDVSAFPCGVYIVEAKTEKGITVKKFVKE